jgi:hypothetical protein
MVSGSWQTGPMATKVHRVVVRGHFDALTDEQRAALLAEIDDHDIFKAAYTEWGSFTYEKNLVWFNLRYEVRTEDEDADSFTQLPGAAAGGDHGAGLRTDAADIGLAKARAQLEQWGLGYKHLRATATDMSTMWNG